MATKVNTMASLPVFPSFDVHMDGNPGPRWKKWLEKFQRFLIVCNVSDDSRRRAMLLYYAGDDVDEIFTTLADTGDDYKKAHEALTKHAAYEISKFRQAKQEKDESIDTYHVRLRKLT